jgi:hypothetical protein
MYLDGLSPGYITPAAPETPIALGRTIPFGRPDNQTYPIAWGCPETVSAGPPGPQGPAGPAGPAYWELLKDYTIPAGPGVSDVSCNINPAIYDGVEIEWTDPGNGTPPNPAIELLSDAAVGACNVGDSDAFNTVECNRSNSHALVKQFDALGGPRAGIIRMFKNNLGGWFYRSESNTSSTTGDMTHAFSIIMGTVPNWTTTLHANVTSPNLLPGGRWVFRGRRLPAT